MNSDTRTRRETIQSEVIKYTTSAVILLVGFGALMYLKSFAKPPADRESTSLIPQVDVQEVVAYAGNLDFEVSGTVVPFREINVAAEVGGRVTNKTAACEAGNFVSKGDVLLEIDPEEYRLEIATQKANLDQAKRRIEENQQLIAGERKNIELAQSDTQLQRATSERNRRLNNVLSKSELDQSDRALIASESQLTLRKTNLSSLLAAASRLKAGVDLAERQLDKAKLNLRRATVAAPEDGVIVSEMVQKGDFVSRGTPLLTFEDTRQSEVVCNLTTSELNQIRNYATGLSDTPDLASQDIRSVYKLPPTPVTIYDPAMPEVTWSGTLERFDGIGVDSVTKTIPCRISIDQPIAQTDNGSVALVRGMFVKCRLEFRVSSGSGRTQYIAIPESAVHPNAHVWVVSNDTLQRKKIRVVDRVVDETVDGVSSENQSAGSTSRSQAIIEQTPNSPQPGDWVVVSPLSQPSENAKVEVAAKNGQTVRADPKKLTNADAE